MKYLMLATGLSVMLTIGGCGNAANAVQNTTNAVGNDVTNATNNAS